VNLPTEAARKGKKREGGFQTMKPFVLIAAATLFALLPACAAQTASHKSNPEPRADATAPELFEYVRSALLLLSPDDGINDNAEVTFDWTKNVMTIAQPGGHCDLFLSALNTNNVAWDIYDPSDNLQTRDKLLRLTLVSVSNTKARTCYDKMNHVDESVPGNRVRLLFSLTKVEQWPGFQTKIAKAIKRLIVLRGGEPPKELF
jgi:hypothetical protein